MAMPLEIVTIPCLQDNYAFLLHNPDMGQTVLVDAPEAAPILEVLRGRGWTLDHVWLTHHHWDHVDGLAGLLDVFSPKVWGAAQDAERLPELTHALAVGEGVDCAGLRVEIIDVPGHTLGHIAYYVPAEDAVFTADSLMVMGCGRLFEGTPENMWSSLQKLMNLPPETRVYSGHEYTASNCKFALTIDPHNSELISRVAQVTADRAAGRPTVPALLGLECATNPFLRANDPAIREGLGMTDATVLEVFTKIRALKDKF
jgi:hydroxyacylglutathione hydrolase